jgi:hypothetical protein
MMTWKAILLSGTIIMTIAPLADYHFLSIYIDRKFFKSDNDSDETVSDWALEKLTPNVLGSSIVEDQRTEFPLGIRPGLSGPRFLNRTIVTI